MVDLSDRLINGVKRFEGFSRTPYWDFRQYTSGYGTRANSPNEVIDQATANSRLQDALSGAASSVDRTFPNLPAGTRDALISLTYNAGPAWMTQGLGNAIRAGDMNAARTYFAQYNHAGGQVNPGLTQRRQSELGWFDNQPPVPPASIPNMPGSPVDMGYFARARGLDLPLFAPQQPQPQQQPPQATQAPAPSFFSTLAALAPSSAPDLQNWYNRQIG
jgi:GH24 family phage-related lysozyme (muramidase)